MSVSFDVRVGLCMFIFVGVIGFVLWVAVCESASTGYILFVVIFWGDGELVLS